MHSFFGLHLACLAACFILVSCSEPLPLAPDAGDGGWDAADAADDGGTDADATPTPEDAAIVPADAAKDAALPEDAAKPDASCVDDEPDGVCDDVDVCPGIADPDQADTDDDGVGDACECEDVVCPAGDACHGASSCDPGTGECTTRPTFDDETLCDDGNACTSGDRCTDGTCGGTGVTCPGATDCRGASTCDPSSGACLDGPAVEDGTSCDDASTCTVGDACVEGSCTGTPAAAGTYCNDGSSCTLNDGCAAGSCVGTQLICAPIDVCHIAAVCTPELHPWDECPQIPIGGCGASVTVNVVDAMGVGLSYVTVVAYDGAVEVGRRRTIWNGNADFLLPTGADYRFVAVRNGVPTWSATVDHCTVPACSSLQIALGTTSDYVVLSYEPFPFDGPDPGPGLIRADYPHKVFGGVYVENWAVAAYATPQAALTNAHWHVGSDCAGSPGHCGNWSHSELQHPFGGTLQGLWVALPDGTPFDLVSLDYRVREDVNPEHVQTIPGIDPSTVEIWIAVGEDPATATFVPYPVGTRDQMASFRTLRFSSVTNVTGVLITSTWEVSFDDVVLRPVP